MESGCILKSEMKKLMLLLQTMLCWRVNYVPGNSLLYRLKRRRQREIRVANRGSL